MKTAVEAKYFGILILLLPIYFGEATGQLIVTPNGGVVNFGQSIQFRWQWPFAVCDGYQIQFCPGTQTQGCSIIATLSMSVMSYQWNVNRIGDGRFRLQYNRRSSGCRVPALISGPFSPVFNLRCLPLSIGQHPNNEQALIGHPVQFFVSASGSQLSYQWLFNGQPIAGARQPTYAISSVQLVNGGQYSVRLQDACQASVTSNAATLRVCPLLVIRQFSPILQAEVGRPFTLQVDATGPDLQFIWSKEGRIISRANSLNFANFQPADYGEYSVRIEAACEQHTELQIVLYSSPFAIVANPPSEIFLFLGDSIQLDVQVLRGNFDVNYQWFREGIPIRGATAPSYNVTNFSFADNDTHYVVSVSANGHTITSDVSTILAYPSPVIASLSVDPGSVWPMQDVTFSVIAIGQSLQYEWLINGVLEERATGLTSIQITATDLTSSAEVVVRVSNPNGVVDSEPMKLLIKPRPEFLVNYPFEYFTLLNQTITLDLTNLVTGEDMSFRWIKNNNTIIQRNETTLEVQLDPAIVSTSYQLEAMNPSGSTFGPLMWVHPEPAPEITGHSESPLFYFAGQSPTLYINATGQGVQYRWFRGSEFQYFKDLPELMLWPLSEQDNGLVIRGEGYNVNGFSSSVNFTLKLEPAPVIVQQMPTPITVFMNRSAELSIQAVGNNLTYIWSLQPALHFVPKTDDRSTIEVPNVVTPFYANVRVQNPSGSVTSNNVFVIIHPPPEFVRQFRTIIPVVVNQTLLLIRTALGAGVTYTWSVNDSVVLADATDTFQLTRVGMQYNGTYVKVTASNPSGSVSAQSMIIVVTRPTLQTPLQQVYEVLVTSSLTVNVDSNDYGVTYEWRHNGTFLKNSTGPLEISEVGFRMSGMYQLFMHNLAGSTGPYAFRVVVVQLQVRSLNGTHSNVFEGEDLTLSVTLSTQNHDILDIKWYRENEEIEGAYTTSLTIANVSDINSGHYEIYIGHNRNRLSYVTRSVTTVAILGGPVLQQPIYNQPLYDVQAGNIVTLSAMATPFERMTYQWLRNGEPIEAETGRILTFEATYAMDGHLISVELTNPADSITSEPVKLRVRMSDTAISMIVVFVGGALIAGVILTIIFVRRKINQRRQITYNKATYGIDDFKYRLLPAWKAPLESKLATKLDLLPVTFSKTVLTFGGETRFNVNQEYTDTIEVKWQGGFKLAISTLHQSNKRMSKKTTDLNIPLIDTSKKGHNFPIIFHPPRTQKLKFTAHPDEVSLDYRWRPSRPSVYDSTASGDDTVLFKLELNVSTSVTALIGVEMPAIGKHFYIPCDIVANQSVWIDIDEIEMDPVPVGSGSYGVVHKGQYKGKTVAVKKLIVQEGLDPKSLEEFEREIHFLSELRNPGIVSLIGASKLPGKLAIVTEFLANGSLEKWMAKKLPYATKLQIALEVAKAIDYLHKNNVLHRDIKSENVLVESLDVNSPNMIRLSDFGSARRFAEDKMETFTKAVGTPIYMAPEVMTTKNYSKEADIYSFGILLWVIITQKEPYTAFMYNWDVSNFVLSGQREVIPAGCPAEYAELITGCWAHEPEKRTPLPVVIEKLDKMLKQQFVIN